MIKNKENEIQVIKNVSEHLKLTEELLKEMKNIYQLISEFLNSIFTNEQNSLMKLKDFPDEFKELRTELKKNRFEIIHYGFTKTSECLDLIMQICSRVDLMFDLSTLWCRHVHFWRDCSEKVDQNKSWFSSLNHYWSFIKDELAKLNSDIKEFEYILMQLNKQIHMI